MMRANVPMATTTGRTGRLPAARIRGPDEATAKTISVAKAKNSNPGRHRNGRDSERRCVFRVVALCISPRSWQEGRVWHGRSARQGQSHGVPCTKYHKWPERVSSAGAITALLVVAASAILFPNVMADRSRHRMTQEPTSTEDHSGDDAIARASASVKENLPQTLLLSQVLGPTLAAGQPRAYVPPTAAIRSEARDLLHQKALRDIVRLRFEFPTEKYHDYKTYVNVPQRSMGVHLNTGAVAYPDIVVVQHPENNTKIVAEVETNETVREAVG